MEVVRSIGGKEPFAALSAKPGGMSRIPAKHNTMNASIAQSRFNPTEPLPLGILCALFLFTSIPIIQTITRLTERSTPPAEEVLVMIPPPEVFEAPPPLPPPPPAKTLEPEITKPVVFPSMDQINMILNPTAGEGVGDYALPDISGMMETEIEFDDWEVDEKPVPTKQISPNYPPRLKSMGISGKVNLLIVVDSNGSVRNIKVERSSHPDFDRPSIDALSRWKFKPGMKDGKAVNTRVRVPMVFSL